VHKSRFIAQYKGRYETPFRDFEPFCYENAFALNIIVVCSGDQRSTGPPSQGSSRKLSMLLLLSMFAIAEHYCEDATTPGHLYETGCRYFEDAQAFLSKSKILISYSVPAAFLFLAKAIHFSCASTVQALLLMGCREFGMGKRVC
jgi:Fungal specific transcription factor domain